MRGKSANPNLAKLDRVAQALKVERNWLIHGVGEVQGEEPIVEHPDDSFVAISMGGGHLVEHEPVQGRP
jgi:transcriptional regulator with XRE-family HTH domain